MKKVAVMLGERKIETTDVMKARDWICACDWLAGTWRPTTRGPFFPFFVDLFAHLLGLPTYLLDLFSDAGTVFLFVGFNIQQLPRPRHVNLQ